MKVVQKYKEHPSIIAIDNAFPYQSFSLKLGKNEMFKETKNLKSSKANKKVIYLQKLLKKLLACLLISHFLPLANVSKSLIFRNPNF